MSRDLVIFRADEECSGGQWWESAHEHAESAPAPVRSWLRSAGPEVRVWADSYDDADRLVDDFLSWAEELPGWDSGPEYAPHPVILRTVSEEHHLASRLASLAGTGRGCVVTDSHGIPWVGISVEAARSILAQLEPGGAG